MNQLITCAGLFTEFPIHIFTQQPITCSGGLWSSVYYSEYKCPTTVMELDGLTWLHSDEDASSITIDTILYKWRGYDAEFLKADAFPLANISYVYEMKMM